MSPPSTLTRTPVPDPTPNPQLCDSVPTEVQALSSSVTSWAVATNNLIGTVCCEALPATHTCSPTFVPTRLPTTPLPTMDCGDGYEFNGASCSICKPP